MKPLPHLKPTALAFLICAVAIAIYANTFGHGFVFDDVAVLSGNTYVKEGVAGLNKILTTGSWLGFNPERNLRIYRPLQLSVLAVQYEFFKLNPIGYHIVHVLSYALLCASGFLLLSKLLKDHVKGATIALTAALLFTLHPVHTEVAANIKGNGDLLAMLFGIWTLLCVRAYGESGRWLHIASAAILFLIALFFKETAITIGGVAALMLYYFYNHSIRKIALAILPLLIPVALYLTARNLVFEGNANSLVDTTTNISNVVLVADGWSQEIGLRMWALGKNLQLLVFPYPLLMMYVFDSIPMVEAYEMESLLPCLIYTLITLGFLWSLPRRTLLGFAAGCYLCTIFLFSNILFSIPNIVSERWLLLPSFAFCLAIATLLSELSKHYPRSARILTCIVCFGYAGYTVQRNFAWKDNLTLAVTDMRTAPRNYNVIRMAGSELYKKGTRGDAIDRDLLKQSALAMEGVLRITANNYNTRNTLGKAYEQLGNHQLAAYHFDIANNYESDIKDKASYSLVKNLVYARNYVRALEAAEALEKDHPTNAGLIALKAEALIGLERYDEALQAAQKSLELKPNYWRGLKGLAEHQFRITKAAGFTPEALKKSADLYEKWLAVSQGSAEETSVGYNTLGQIYKALKEPAKAAHAFGLAARQPSSIQGKARFSEARQFNLAQQYTTALPLWQALEIDYPEVISVTISKCIALVGADSDADTLLEQAAKLSERLSNFTEELAKDQCRDLNSVAIALEKRGAHTLAASLFLKAASAPSGIRAKAAYSAGKNLQMAERYDEALAQWKKVNQDYPDILIVEMRIAEVLEALNQQDEALSTYQRIVQKYGQKSLSESQQKSYSQALEKLKALGQ